MIGFDTDSPSPSISVHVAVDMQGSSGTSWVDFVDSTGACVVIAIYVITVNGKVKLGAGVDWGHKNEQSYEECLLEERDYSTSSIYTGFLYPRKMFVLFITENHADILFFWSPHKNTYVSESVLFHLYLRKEDPSVLTSFYWYIF